ncbi:zinc ribbon domain-containing protein [Frankia sp. AgPm24]|uniref:zinc ribbon domain-containing protein n=1 Tax=Frankia sp. AgPm24 TaxID=631128 RepID=UPI00200EA26F|nr:zinc ribbon domain-containing protein [Frankia sp. AgPm24]
MFDEFNANRQTRRGSREHNELNRHPATKRTYVFRGMIHCTCGRRMFGAVREPSPAVWYLCWPRANNRGRDDRFAGHPKSVRIREDILEAAVVDFYTERVFGRDRVALLTAELATYDDRAARDRAAERDRLHKKIDDLKLRQDNLLRHAQVGDPDDPFTQGLRSSYNELDTERRAALGKIKDLDAADDTEPDRPGQASLALLDALPELHLKLHQAPEALQRRLYEITQLTVHLDHERQEVHMMIKIPVMDLDKVANLAEVTADTAATAGARPAATEHPRRVDAVRAPGRNRTYGLPLRRKVVHIGELTCMVAGHDGPKRDELVGPGRGPDGAQTAPDGGEPTWQASHTTGGRQRSPARLTGP